MTIAHRPGLSRIRKILQSSRLHAASPLDLQPKPVGPTGTAPANPNYMTAKQLAITQAKTYKLIREVRLIRKRLAREKSLKEILANSLPDGEHKNGVSITTVRSHKVGGFTRRAHRRIYL